MPHQSRRIAFLMFVVTTPAIAQTRTIDLTGRPLAVISAPMSSVTTGVELANGKFLFVDSRVVVIRLADFSRDDVQGLSRTGSGPNEYKMPSKAIPDGKGGAIVPDQMLARAVLISGSGEVVGTGLDRQEAGIAPIAIRGFDPTGRVYRYGRAGSMGQDSLPIERWDPATKEKTVLAWWPQTPAVLGPLKKGPDGRMGASISSPSLFPLRPEWAMLPDGSVAIAYPVPFRIDIVTPAGVRVKGPVIRFEPIKVTSAYRAWFAKERGPTPEELFPATLPPFEDASDVLASNEGEVWVHRLRNWNDSIPKYEIYSKKGILTGRAILSPHAKVIGFGKGVVYVARQSQEDDFWHLEKYSVKR